MGKLDCVNANIFHHTHLIIGPKLDSCEPTFILFYIQYNEFQLQLRNNDLINFYEDCGSYTLNLFHVIAFHVYVGLCCLTQNDYNRLMLASCWLRVKIFIDWRLW